MRKAILYQVLGGSILTSFNQATDEEFNSGAIKNFNRTPRWYTKAGNPVVYDPHVLVSSAHYSHYKDLRTKIQADDDTIIFVDSGGYQLASGVKPNHTREKALEWSEANGNLFPILDKPAQARVPLDESIQYTIESAKYYADNRTNNDCTVMNVLSATSHSGMDRWYKAIKDFKFDGWCYGGHSNALIPIIQSILYLESKGEFNRKTNLHIFGTTSLAVMPYIMYAQYLLDKKDIDCQLSFDSSYAFRNAGFGKYFIFPSFNGMGALVLSNKNDWSKLDEFGHFGCDCEICKGITDIPHLFSGNAGSHFYSQIGMHNFIMMLRFKETIEGLLSMNVPEMLKSLPKNMRENFAIMDEAFSHMGDTGINIIARKFNTKTSAKSTVLKSLDAFM